MSNDARYYTTVAILVLFAAAVLIVVTGCSAAPTANALACRHWQQQTAWVKDHQATLTLADIATIGGWIQDDANESTGMLHRDFAAYSAAYQSLITYGSNTKKAEAAGDAARHRITRDCASS